MDEQVVAIGGAVGAGIALGLLVLFVLSAIGKVSKKKKSAHANPAVQAGGKDTAEIILKSIDDGVVLIDEAGTIKVFNPAASRITGWQTEDANGLPYDSVIKLIDEKDVAYDAAANPFMRAIKEQTTIRDSRGSLVSHSGRHISLGLTVSPLLNDENQAYGAVGVFRDISREREQEAQRGEFISTASHEMRTPIAAIEGYLSLIRSAKDQELNEKNRGYLDKAYESTQHLGKLFQDLLSSSQVEDGRMISDPKVVEVGAFIEELLQDLRFVADKKNLSVELILSGESGQRSMRQTIERVLKPFYYVYIDPDRLREVVTNLFDNAVKYSNEGTLSVSLTGNDDVVQIGVKDMGIGIPPEDLPHLFQKFYRVDNSATRTIGGTGLGLFIARMIIEQASGKIWATSEPGKGSTFFINLPRLSTSQAESMQNDGEITRPTQKITMVQ